jgi:hypothetical protein
MIPSMIDALHLDQLLDHFDGILMTGAASNVHPPQWREPPPITSPMTTPATRCLKLIRRVIERHSAVLHLPGLRIERRHGRQSETNCRRARLPHHRSPNRRYRLRSPSCHCHRARRQLEQMLGKRET